VLTTISKRIPEYDVPGVGEACAGVGLISRPEDLRMTSHERASMTRQPIVRMLLVALAIDAGFLAWSPFHSDGLNIAVAVGLLVVFGWLGALDARERETS
jgi:hypothetical protein